MTLQKAKSALAGKNTPIIDYRKYEIPTRLKSKIGFGKKRDKKIGFGRL